MGTHLPGGMDQMMAPVAGNVHMLACFPLPHSHPMRVDLHIQSCIHAPPAGYLSPIWLLARSLSVSPEQRWCVQLAMHARSLSWALYWRRS